MSRKHRRKPVRIAPATQPIQVQVYNPDQNPNTKDLFRDLLLVSATGLMSNFDRVSDGLIKIAEHLAKVIHG